jgi:hypothetical protein
MTIPKAIKNNGKARLADGISLKNIKAQNIANTTIM